LRGRAPLPRQPAHRGPIRRGGETYEIIISQCGASAFASS
jgi:hypothetical protein